MILAASAASLLIGVVVGWFVAVRRAHESDESPGVLESPDVAAGVPGSIVDVVDGLGLAVVVSDAVGRVVYSNRAATSLSGTHVGLIIDGHVTDALEAALRGREDARRIELHGPPPMVLDLQARRIGDGAVAILEDVSEQVRVDAMRTDFVANISHELKTPMGAIAVLAEALDGEDDAGVIERMSSRIVAESIRAAETIDDLLELSRIEASGADHDDVELCSVIDVAIARGRALDPTVDVSAITPQTKVRLRGDRRQLTSAIGNLVENAVKFSESGGTVQVRMRVDDRAVEVMVTDQGPGIPERDLLRIFERFYRVDRARSRDTGGTGLGLAIVRHVATNHGGDVQASSIEGDGSTFVFRLPASLVIHDTGDQVADGNEDDTEDAAAETPGRILEDR